MRPSPPHKFGIKWNSVNEAKKDLRGTPEQVERQAQARLKAQDLFQKIRNGQIK
jgi:hypothetical protein